jgi:phosphoesterase RecJ-like protein
VSQTALIAEAAVLLQEAAHVLVVGHEHPDGDAIGSTVAVGLIAEMCGAEVVYFNVDPVPANLLFLPRAGDVVSELPAGFRPDVTVIVDCAQRSRVGARFPAAGWGPTVVCFDHHKTFDLDVADVLVRDANAAATAELVFELSRACGVEITHDLGTALYCALLTDTGSFRYGKTRPETMERAAALLRAGVDAWDVASQVYESEPIERMRLMSEVLNTLDLAADGKLATIVITDEMYARTGADPSMTDGFVNLARSVRGVEVAAQLVEQQDGTFRVGMRSRGRVDVASVAEHFGGGGHKNAAGFASALSLADLRDSLGAALLAVIESP